LAHRSGFFRKHLADLRTVWRFAQTSCAFAHYSRGLRKPLDSWRIDWEVIANLLIVGASFERFAQTSCALAHRSGGLRKPLVRLCIVWEVCANLSAFAHRFWEFRKPLVRLHIV
jgi:hypothetical protein